MLFPKRITPLGYCTTQPLRMQQQKQERQPHGKKQKSALSDSQFLSHRGQPHGRVRSGKHFAREIVAQITKHCNPKSLFYRKKSNIFSLYAVCVVMSPMESFHFLLFVNIYIVFTFV
jgi:hypothetical protein